MALLLQMADAMFPEGQGAPRAMAKVDAAAEKSNELLVNAKEAVDELWRQRGLDPKKPELTKARLGYALDKEEAVGYVVTGAMHLPRLSPDEARAIGKRIVALVGASGTARCSGGRPLPRCRAAVAGGSGRWQCTRGRGARTRASSNGGRSGGWQAAVRHDTVVTRRRRSSRDGGVE